MAELISKSATSKKIKEFFKSIVDSHYYKLDIVDTNASLQRELNELPTTTEAEIRNKAIYEFAERLRKKCDSVTQEEWNNNVQPTSWADAYKDFKDDIDEIAESLKIVCVLERLKEE